MAKKSTQAAAGSKSRLLSNNSPLTKPLLFITFFAVVGVIFLIRSFAASGQLRLVASTPTVQNGQSITVQVRVNPDSNVIDAVDGMVTYDSTKLQYLSVDATGTAFDFDATGSGVVQGTAAGTLRFGRGTNTSPDVTSDALILTLTFKALVGSGNTSMAISGNASDPNAQLIELVGGSISVGFTEPIVVTTGTISGTVTSSNTSAVSGATISYVVNGSKRSTKTASNGSYTIPNLPVGTYSLKFAAKRHQNQTVSAGVTAGNVTTQNVVLQLR
jgi:hypothetical protein